MYVKGINVLQEKLFVVSQLQRQARILKIGTCSVQLRFKSDHAESLVILCPIIRLWHKLFSVYYILLKKRVCIIKTYIIIPILNFLYNQYSNCFVISY